MEEKRQPAVRVAVELGRKQLDASGMMLVGVFKLVIRSLGVIVGLLLLGSLAGAVGVTAYFTFKRW